MYGRVAFELPSRQVLSLDSILNLFLLLRPDFESILPGINNDIRHKSDFERNTMFFDVKADEKSISIYLPGYIYSGIAMFVPSP